MGETNKSSFTLMSVYVLSPGINRKLTYRILDSEVFKIDEKSGLIQLAKPLDRETIPAYKITVLAVDQVRLAFAAHVSFLPLAPKRNGNSLCSLC